MNKKIEEYKRKSDRIIRTFELLGVSIFILGTLISIVYYAINKSKSNEENQKLVNGDLGFSIDLEDDTVIYQENLKINLKINDFEIENNYKIIVRVDNEIVVEQGDVEQQVEINVKLIDEGIKKINIIIYINNEETYNKELTIYYIKPYVSQFFDEFSNKGVQVHYRGYNEWERYNKSLDMISALGAKKLRSDIWYHRIANSKGKYDFTYYDEWIKEATNRDLDILLEFNGFTINGFSSIIDTDEEREEFANFVTAVINRYPQILHYEVLNEPNLNYITEENVKEYSRLVKIVKDIVEVNNPKIDIFSGVLANKLKSTDTYMSATEFFKILNQNNGYVNSDVYSYHPYDKVNVEKQNSDLKKSLFEYKELFNNFGRFYEKCIYGVWILFR